MRRRLDVLIISVLVTGLAISSCSKKSTPDATTGSSAAPVAVVTVDLGPSIGGDKHVTDKSDSFKPNDTVYASVLTTGSAASATLKARWTFEDGQVVEESEQAIAPTGDAATEFHISKPDGWPVGKYKLEVFLNGVPVQTKDFEVK